MGNLFGPYTVYYHLFPNGKMYVGITRRDPHSRWAQGKGYRSQSFVYNAIRKYGWEKIEHVIFATRLTEEAAKQMEKNLIKEYHTMNPRFGYNQTAGGDGSSRYDYEEIIGMYNAGQAPGHIREKLSCRPETVEKVLKQSGISAEERISRGKVFKEKAILEFDMNGVFIAKHRSSVEAGKATGQDRSSISKCCRKELLTCGGHRWVLEEEYLESKEM